MDRPVDGVSEPETIVVPPAIVSTCHANPRLSYEVKTERTDDRGRRRVMSMFLGVPETSDQLDSDPPAIEDSTPEAVVTSTEVDDAQPHRRPLSISARPQPAAIDFAQTHDSVIGGGGSLENKRDTKITMPSPHPDDEGPGRQSGSARDSSIIKRLSYVAAGFVGSRRDRPSISNDRIPRRFSAQFRPRHDSFDFQSHPAAKRLDRRDSQAVPKSWKFLGIDGPAVEHAMSNVTNRLRHPNFGEMYEKAKIKQNKIQRSKTGQRIFRYTFYLMLVATVYLLFVGLPLWRGLVWYMYILFKKHLVLKAGLTITLGLGFLYAYCPLLINFEPTAPLPEADESGRAKNMAGDTALIIPCYKSEKIVGATLEAALKIFPKQSIFVIANGNSAEPLDNTADVCRQYDVSHTWSPLGSKIIAQFVGCYVARKFPNALLIDDDCLLPPNLPIVSDRLKGNIKCIGYIMRVVGENGSKGTLCQQAQDLEYKLSGLAKSFAGKVGSVTFPHGCMVLWDRELLVRTFQAHPGFSVSEDWFFGHAARQLGSRITMCTSTFVETETPSAIFSSSGGARGGFGEMTVWKQRFYRWNYFFVTGMYYDLMYILFDSKLGWWEIGAKIFVFQEIYETILYLLAPFVVPISFATRPVFATYIYVATIVMYTLNALIFNYVHLRTRNETVSFKAFLYYVAFKWILGFINIASCYYAIYTYATYFAKRHPKVVEDDKAVEIVLRLEEKETYLSEKGEIDDLNELMYKIAKPVVTDGGGDGGGVGGMNDGKSGTRGNRQSVMVVKTVGSSCERAVE